MIFALQNIYLRMIRSFAQKIVIAQSFINIIQFLAINVSWLAIIIVSQTTTIIFHASVSALITFYRIKSTAMIFVQANIPLPQVCNA